MSQHHPTRASQRYLVTPLLSFITKLHAHKSRWLIVGISVLFSACQSISPTADHTQKVAPRTLAHTPKVALVLGGGGAKGFAHIGVIKALEQNGITPTLIVGTSVGSLIGSLYASGISAHTLEQLALNTPDSAFTDFTVANQGFVEGIRLKNFINTHVGARSIENFPIQFAAIAAEKQTLQKTVFSQGDAGLAVQASCSVPNIFIAPRIPEHVGKKYVDGGMVSLIPVDSARDLGADIIIAVDITAAIKPDMNMRTLSHTLPNRPLFNYFWGLFDYNMSDTLNPTHHKSVSSMTLEAQRADILITPNISHISVIDTSQRRALITAGEQATNAQITAIKQRIANKKTP